MHSRICMLLFITLVLVSTLVQAGRPQRIILDTDISSDVDDAGAVAVLHALADKGTLNILGMMVSSGDQWGASCLDAFNTSFGRPDIPIGEIKGKAVTHVSKYTQYIAENYPNDLLNQAVPDAIDLYRKLLAGQPDGSVTIVSIGYLSNLATLLKSDGDGYSPLDGLSLVKRKVKVLVTMGGEFPAGREWNLYQDAGAAVYVTGNWPTPITFCGFEIGKRIKTGKALQAAPQRHPLRQAYQLYNKLTNRQSWDQAAILLAVEPRKKNAKYWAISPKGKVVVDDNGANVWTPVQVGVHRYMLWDRKTGELAQKIDDLMLLATQAN